MPASTAQILPPQARALLFDPPTGRDEALRRCALAPEDLALAQRHRRSHNRLGFAIQLALVRDLGRPLRLDETLPDAVVEAVADQIGVEPAVFGLYARRDGTRREHAGEIAALLGLRPMQQADYRASIRAAAACAAGTDKGEPIARAVVADLKERRITMPPPALVERLALAGRALARRQSHRDLIRGLGDAQAAALQALLTERAEDVRSQGVVLTDEELSHVAPLRWDHIALTGDYLWSNVDTPRERFRPLRTSRFRPDAFRTPQAA